MKSYLDLVPISAKVHKRQNRMTLLCITIAVFLVTSIFSMADMAIQMERARAIERHGNWHIQLKNMSERDTELIRARPDVAAASWLDTVNEDLSEDYKIDGNTAVVCGAEEALVTEIMSSLAEGNYPRSDREVLLTTNAKDILDAKVGDRVTVNTPSSSADYIISGFGGDAIYTSLADEIGVFMNRQAFQAFFGPLKNEASDPVFYVRLKENVNSRKVISDIREQYGLTDENLSENTALLGLTGFSSDSYVMGLYLVAGMLFVLVLAAGVFMIVGSLTSKTAERSQFFGMLRCIGASRAQIIRFVRLEALNWCKTAVPAGILLGVVITWGLCAMLRFGLGGEFADMHLFRVSGIGICCGIVVGLLTVFLSAQTPAKRAARVSPMAAVSGGTGNAKNVHHAANTRFTKIETALGVHHAVSAKKNLILMTGSFTLSIVMFLGFSAILAWTNQAIPSLRAWTPDLSIASQGAVCAIDKGLVAEMERQPGVKRAFGRMYRNIPAEYQGKAGSIDLISYEAYQFEYAEEDLADGDLSQVRGGSNSVLTVFDKSNSLKVGDKIQLDGAELEVAGVLETSPFDSSDTPTVICSEEVFQRLTGDNAYAIIDIQLTRKATDADVNKIRAMAGDEYRFIDRRESNQEANGTYWMFNLFVYGFLAIIAMITVLNIVNSISMSVSARIKQYGAMRAVGMAGRQVTKMIAAETATYVLSGFVVGCAVGLPLHRFLFARLITAYWGTPWKMPFTAVTVIVLLIVLASIAAAYAPAKRIRNMMVTDTINEL